ncbi:hypothetical protein LCGC14_2457360, partial [marine sediment metagenome]
NYGMWWAIPRNIVYGQGHPKRGIKKSAKSRTISVSVIKERVKKVHGDLITLNEFTYRGTSIRCQFIDKDYGEWWARPIDIISSRCGHPKRGHKKSGRARKISIKDVKAKIEKIYGNVIQIDEFTYINTRIKCKFIDKDYGEWWALPSHIFNQTCFHPKRSAEKKKQFNLKKYGVEHPMQDLKIALKCARMQNNSYILKHWKTNEEIICVASYEKKVVEYFNKNKINLKKYQNASK